MDVKDLDTLVFSGGGVRGLAYAGALMAFEDTFRVSANKHFQTFGGTSVGALFALVCCLDINVGEALNCFESVGLERIFSQDPTCILANFALNDGTVLQQLVETLFHKKGLANTITFEELFAVTEKRLVVTVVDLLTGSTLYMDHITFPSISVLSAVMGSTALPPMFPPVNVTNNGRHYLLSDGGLLDNFPLARFDAQKTLGIRTNWYICPGLPGDIASYYTRVLSIMQLTMHTMQAKVATSYPYLVHIDLGHVEAANAALDTRDAVFKGYRAAIARFAQTSFANHVERPARFLSEAALELPQYLAKASWNSAISKE